MALLLPVKVGSLTNLSDARYCAAMGVTMLGFTLEAESPEFVPAAAFGEMAGWLAGVQLWGEGVTATAETLAAWRAAYALDGLQVESSPDWAGLAAAGLPLLCRVDWDQIQDATRFRARYESVAPHVRGFVLESQHTELSPDRRTELGRLAVDFPLLLGFGLHPESVRDVVAELPVWGLALRGSAEIRPGYKDYGELADVLEKLETEDDPGF